MRVLAVTPGAELYGSDRVFLESVRGFLAAGHEVRVVAGAPGPLLEAAAEAGARVEVAALPVLRRRHASPAGLVSLAREVAAGLPQLIGLARRSGADVSYVNTATLPVWAVAARAAGLPLVVHVHEAESTDPRVVRTVLSAPLLGASRVVFNSATSARLARRDLAGALRRFVVVPNAVALPADPAPARERLDGPVRLVYVGRLSQRKGAHVALEALAELDASGIEAHLDVVGEVFAGNEAYAAQLRERAARPDLRDRVSFHGFQADPAPFVAAADIALVPSCGPESFGNVLVEAVGAARPTVAARQAGLAEAAQGMSSVQLVEPGDAAALARGIRHHVQGWDTARLAALDDARVLRDRHAAHRYHQGVTAAVTQAAPAAAPTTGSARDLVGDAPVLVVSPHLDDAVLSAHALLHLDRPVDVLTVLDGAPDPTRATGWDRLCGFADSTAAVAARHRENSAAMTGLPHTELSLGLLDSQYLDGPRPSGDGTALAEAVQEWAAAHPGPVVIAVPAGAGRPTPGTHRASADAQSTGQNSSRRARREAIRRAVGPLGRALLDVRATLVARHTRPFCHDDHVWVRDTILASAPPAATVVLYEDLPYLWGRPADDAVAALETSRPGDTAGTTATCVAVDREAKARRVGAYASQLRHMHAPLGRLDRPDGLPASERYWLIQAQATAEHARERALTP